MNTEKKQRIVEIVTQIKALQDEFDQILDGEQKRKYTRKEKTTNTSPDEEPLPF